MDRDIRRGPNKTARPIKVWRPMVRKPLHGTLESFDLNVGARFERRDLLAVTEDAPADGYEFDFFSRCERSREQKESINGIH